MRVRSIDIFRGIAIVLMVFFSIYGVLSSTPDLLQHNQPNSVHFGDFILPMFLFASGMSLVFFAKKRGKEGMPGYALDCANRLTQLLLVSAFLTLFRGFFLGMDEVMLSALLFIPSALLIALPEAAIAGISLLIFASYLSLSSFNALPDFSAAYLGGYPAALFYLPVMLGGVIAGKRILEGKSINSLLFVSIALSIALLLLSPPYKNDVSPSFMALSILLSLVVFIAGNALLGKGSSQISGFFEYLGRKPIRYWVLMFVVLLIPLEAYSFLNGLDLPLETGVMPAFIISLLCVFVLYLLSLAIDALAPRIASLAARRP